MLARGLNVIMIQNIVFLFKEGDKKKIKFQMQ